MSRRLNWISLLARELVLRSVECAVIRAEVALAAFASLRRCLSTEPDRRLYRHVPQADRVRAAVALHHDPDLVWRTGAPIDDCHPVDASVRHAGRIEESPLGALRVLRPTSRAT